jgi:hypothetical protein
VGTQVESAKDLLNTLFTTSVIGLVTSCPTTGTNSEPTTSLKDKIGEAVRKISNRVERNEDITLEDAAVAVRCVLAIWASRVLHVGDDVQETEAREPEMFGPAECKRGVSPFMEAASKVSLEIVQLLHRRGA